MQKIRVANGTYTQLRFVNFNQHGDVYRALFVMNDGYTERRVLTVKNGQVVAWQS